VDIFAFSKRGDKGETSLLTGQRVSKASLRPEAYGTLDEASSALGVAKVFTQNTSIQKMIFAIQEDLITLGAELSCESLPDEKHRIQSERIDRLEDWIYELQHEIPLPRHFVYPGVNAVSAFLDLSRTIVRRAERNVVALKESGCGIRTEVHAYLNRLADFLFTLARYAEKKG
jgi:cob(I)alamin adenosyltransferase